MDWMREIYSDLAVRYAKDETFRGRIEGAVSREGKNISCGDEITLHVKVEGDEISDASFEGVGCIVSQASAAMLVELIRGKKLDEVERIVKEVEKMVRGEEFDEDLVGNLVVFSGISNVPGRSKCFTLAWKTLEEILDVIKSQFREGSN